LKQLISLEELSEGVFHHETHRLVWYGANLFARPFNVPVEIFARFRWHADFASYTAANPLEDERHGLFLLAATLIVRHCVSPFSDRPERTTQAVARVCSPNIRSGRLSVPPLPTIRAALVAECRTSSCRRERPALGSHCELSGGTVTPLDWI
jgi:hypothetical protein